MSTDAISRKALINKFEQWQKQDGYDNGEWNLLVDVITEIKNMPLATDIYVGTKDAISRQAAIDALNELDWKYSAINRGDVVDAIKQLPPIQPEIVRCKDCAKHNVTISKAPYPFKEYVCPLIAFRGEAQGHEFDYQFCAYGKRREVTT